jgi:branched-chain amino acid aminotransferase
MIDACPAWKNFEFCTVKDLNVNVLDLGFIHSDATYDVLSIKGKPNTKLIYAHLDRLMESIKGWRIPFGFEVDDIYKLVLELHNRIGMDCFVWLCITRGIPKSGNPRDLKNCTPNLMAYAKPYYGFNETNTATVCLAKSVLRIPDESIDQRYKNFAWQDLTKAQWEAIDRGYDTALLMDHRGYLTEGPGFNVAIIINDYILTPKHNRLSGITMQFIEEACNDKITFLQSRINGNDLIQMKDMFLTSTAGDIISVTKFEDRDLIESDIQKRVKELLWK